MGILDSIIGKDEKDDEVEQSVGKKSTNPFSISVSFAPLRLSSNQKNSVNLMVKVKNTSPENHLLSVDALLPRESMLGFEPSGINKAAEKRVGEIKSGQTMEIPITIWANNQTKPGNYNVDVTIYSHYIGYDKVLSYAKKNTYIRVV